MNLTFENVLKKNFELVYKIPKEVGERYEELTSFSRGRDFNKEIRDYIADFVDRFSEFLTQECIGSSFENIERRIKFMTFVIKRFGQAIKTVNHKNELRSSKKYKENQMWMRGVKR